MNYKMYKTICVVMSPLIVLWLAFSFFKDSIKYISKGEKTSKKIFIVSLYSVPVILVALGKIAGLLITLTVIFLITEVMCLISIFKLSGKETFTENNDYSEEGADYQQSYKKSYGGIEGLFKGMNKENAKRYYRDLMKKYHPDNEGGDLEKCKVINEEYRRYCKQIY